MVHMTVNLVQIRFASFHTFRGEMVLFRCKHYKKEHLSHYAIATWLEALLIFPLVLLSRVNITEQHERHAVLMLDEIKLTSGLAYNPSKRTAIGRPTIPSADDSCPEDALATHALVFIMLGGVTTRWKQAVAYEFTGNSFSAAAETRALHSDRV